MRSYPNRRLRIESLECRRVLAAVDIPDDLVAQPGSQVTALVQVQESAGTRAAEVRLSFDPNVLTLQDTDVVAGSVWGVNAQVVANVDQAAGTLSVFVFAADSFNGGNGSLIQIRFGVRANAVVGNSTVLNLTNVRLNEGQIVVTPAPQAGADSTDGRITIVADAGSISGSGRVTGFVFADGNQNGLRDSSEGLPGVTIELVSSTGNVLKTQTDTQGNYLFNNVTAGNFTIREVQPNAYTDGGTNSLSITLGAQQVLQDQNFKELGLKAEYLYNRLLTTTVQPAGSSLWIETFSQIQLDAGPTSTADVSVSSPSRLASFSTPVGAIAPQGTVGPTTSPVLPLDDHSFDMHIIPEGETPSPAKVGKIVLDTPLAPVPLIASAQHAVAFSPPIISNVRLPSSENIATHVSMLREKTISSLLSEVSESSSNLSLRATLGSVEHLSSAEARSTAVDKAIASLVEPTDVSLKQVDLRSRIGRH